MSGLIIDSEACVGCGRCVRACANEGIVVEGERPNRLARPTDNCVFCGSCVDACPVGAISIEKGTSADEADLAAFRDIWVFAQTDEMGAIASVALELVGKARELAAVRGCDVVTLLAEGEDAPAQNAQALIAAGADRVLRCRDNRLVQNDAEVYARLICDLARELKPEAILYGATPFGRELAPGVAVRLKTGLTADCTVLEMDAETGLLQQTRPAFGGNLMATIVCPEHRPQMATVRPGIFKAPAIDAAREGTVEDVSLAADVSGRVQVVERAHAPEEVSIADAERLVVLGRGIGSKKALPLMRRLAELLHAEIGCTRPLVEAGWLEYRHQVGQTGVSVAPKLLVSVGVSGAIQHLAGISAAECIIAINEDPAAPIFGAAQYSVVGDACEVVTQLVAQLEGEAGQS